MARLSSKSVEQKILSLFFKPPIHIRSLSINLDMFSMKAHRNLAKLIQQYVRKYRSVPSKETLISFGNSKLDEEGLETIPEALELLDTLPKVKKTEADYYFAQAENFRLGRKMFDLHRTLTGELEQGEVDFGELRKKIVSDILFMGPDEKNIRRGFISDNVRERADNYRRIAGGDMEDIIPFGIEKLDEEVGGMKKSFVTLVYSKTGGGKTRLSINLAYNAAMAGFNVLYVSLEMAFDLIASCFDSRMAAVDSRKIIFGKLDRTDKKKFAKALKRQLKEKLNIWISDIPMGASMSSILEELEVYKAANGVLPDLVIIDYANLLEPTKDYKGRSEKYDYLLKEAHETARYYKIALLTSMQESRDASRADLEKKQKKESLEGVHNIGLSNYAATHCETVIRLKQNDIDILRNRLWLIIDKNRYGESRKKIPLYAAFDLTYIGDRTIVKPKTRVKFEKNKKA